MPISEFLSNVRERVTVAEDVAEVEPAELDQAPDYPSEDALPDDPAPAHRKTSKRRTAPAPSKKVTAGERKSITDALTMMIDMPAAILAFKDPVCGGAVLAQSDEVVKKLVPIVCRNPKLVEWFTSGSGYMDWFGLMIALWPIGKTVWTHHVIRPQDRPEGVSAPDGSRPDFSHYHVPDLA